ncbi:kinase-like protein [Xylariaceae sp. FL1272]|nr:kinase-like protein [Xylariaceae sp. FL1272]
MASREVHWDRKGSCKLYSGHELQLLNDVVDALKGQNRVALSNDASTGITAHFTEHLENKIKPTPQARKKTFKRIGRTLSIFITSDFEEQAASKLLNEAIDKTRCSRSHTNRTGFIPNQELRHILSEVRISEVLLSFDQSFAERLKFWKRTRGDSELKEEARRICGRDSIMVPHNNSSDNACFHSYRKVFAILLLINRPGAIRSFMMEGLCDAHLPLVRASVGKKYVLHRRAPSENNTKTFFLDWKRSTVRLFEQTQWMVLAHSFSSSTRYDDVCLDDDTIIPFIHEEHMYTGAHGEIYKIKIHPEHHDFKENAEFYAVKRIRMSHHGTKEFQKERKTLKRIHHEHIVSLSAAFQHCGFYSLVFPWAKCDLAVYWKSENPKPKCNSERLLWVAKQCEGIAQGLYFLHDTHRTGRRSSLFGANDFQSLGPTSKLYRFWGIHGDLKPSNILWFPDHPISEGMGILKISDFGASELSRTEYRHLPADSISYTAEYQPPELSLPEPDIPMSWTYDVWTLGCLYLEMITWYTGGSQSLKRLQDLKRKSYYGLDLDGRFFQGQYPYIKIKPVVIEVCIP